MLINHRQTLKVCVTFWIVGISLIQVAWSQQPNLVLIVADDAGYADFGFQGSNVIPTPNLDQLASRGVTFDNAYIQSVCSPSRAILATGLYGGRFGYEQNIPSNSSVIGQGTTIGLSPDQTTIFDRLSGLGYQNLYVGKWHLGAHQDDVQGGQLLAPGNRPSQQGVDYFFGLLGGSRPYFVGSESNFFNRLIEESLDSAGIVQETIVESQFDGQYVTDLIGNRSADLITSHHNNQQPFFVFASFTAPHTPMQAKLEDLQAIDAMNMGLAGNRRIYAAMQLALDRAIGVILNRLEDPDGDGDNADSIVNQTLVFFINDNGGDCCDSNTNASSNGILKNGKGSIWEGGIRVPMIMSGAGLDPKKMGTRFPQPVHAGDIVSTFFEEAGGEPESGMFDGVNLLPFANGQTTADPHSIVYIRRPSNLGLACRSGDFKLYHDRNNGFCLFDLKSNPSESLAGNLIGQMPALAESLRQEVTKFDVEFVKRGWNIDNLGVDEFRFREGAFVTANWDVIDGWTNLTDDNSDGQRKLQADDATSTTKLIFRAKNGGDYISTNNLTRANGLEFMANRLQFVTRPEGLNGSRIGTVDGLPVMLTNSPAGDQAAVFLDSFDDSPNFMTFNWMIDLLLYDDLFISGNGNDVYNFSGEVTEYRANRSLIKSGTSILNLSGDNSISGRFEVQEGRINAHSGAAMGVADVTILEPGVLSVGSPLLLSGDRSLSGDGKLIADLTNEAGLFPGPADTVGRLTIDGNYTQALNGCSRFRLQQLDDDCFDRLHVTGDATLGGQLLVDSTAFVEQGEEAQIVSTDSRLIGTFDSVQNIGTGDWQPDYRPDGVWLVAQEAVFQRHSVDSLKLLAGFKVGGGVNQLHQCDGASLAVVSELPIEDSDRYVDVIVAGHIKNPQASTLRISLTALTNTPNLLTTLEVLDLQKNQFLHVDSFVSTAQQQERLVQLPGPVARFINQSDGNVISRLSWRPIGPVFQYPWKIELDCFAWLTTD